MARWYTPADFEKPAKWVWVSCFDPHCCHARALPLAPWRIRWGAQDVFPLLRQRLRCGVCGRGGAIFNTPRPDWRGANGSRYWDPEHFPAQSLRMAGPRRIPESSKMQEARVLAAYVARYRSGDAIRTVDGMCNLYSVTSTQVAIRELVKAIRDLTGNLPPLPAVFPNRMAPVVRTAPDGVRELLMARWGFPPPQIPNQKPRNPYLTNVRNCDSRYWQTYLKKPEHRCLVPFTSFAEPDNNQGSRSIWTWFAGTPPYRANEPRPLLFFAGIWREWEGDRGTKAAPNVGKHLVFNFLTTDASADVMAIHPDATPVILFNEAEREQWMSAPWEIARDLQRPPPTGALRVVATDTKEDAGSPAT